MKLYRLHIFTLLSIKLLMVQNTSQAQICNDWKAQSTAYVIVASTSNDPNYYQWSEISNIMQGVHLSVLNAEVIPVYIQKDINYINFTCRFGPAIAYHYMLKVEVNVNDAGYSTIYNGSARQDVVWYTSSSTLYQLGDYDLKVKITFFDGTIRYRQYKVKVIPRSQKLYKDNVGNTLRKWEGNNPYSQNAIVFSEGFDAYNTNGQEMYYYAAADLIECFNQHGYDVFLLDNKYGTQNIKNNAAIFSSAVSYISSLYGGRLVTAGGVSMGGIISRYALAKAEEDGTPLPVHTFIAIDSPHQGAVISEPLQNFKKDNEEDDEFAKHALSNTAAKQLLNYNAYDPDGGIHNSFYQELNSLNGDGYPHLTKNIGVSFSTDDPNPNTGGWYKITYHTGPISGTVKTFDLTNAEKQSGSWLPKDLTTMSPIIQQASYWWLQLLVPGITALYYPTIEFERFTDPAYIPYYSALDIRNGNSLFDVCILPESTTYHDVLPSDILEEIVTEVILSDVFLQNQAIWGTNNIAGDMVAAGNYVTTLYPQGDVIVQPDARLNIFASDRVMLKPGFRTKAGAEVEIYTNPALTFSCNSKHNINAGCKEELFPTPENGIYEKTIMNKKLINGLQAKLYPNPAHDLVYIEIPGSTTQDLSIQIYNMFNHMVWQQNIHAGENLQFNVGFLPGGSYLVRISDGINITSCKLVKL